MKKSQSSQSSSKSQSSQILEGSYAIALTIKNIKPAVVSAYPITPQTHIVEDLAKFKADGETNYEFIRAESELAAASIAVGSSAAGARVYTATSSQGLLLMTEVVYNIAGMRLPIVMTVANRAVSAPINIWNDQQDIHAETNSGWLIFFAENHQEAVNQHVMAYKLAEQLKIPAMVNVDGFVLTHTYEPVMIPDEKKIKKYLPDFKPKNGEFLDPKNPKTFGAFAAPNTYMEIRQELHDDLVGSLDLINKEYINFNKIFSASGSQLPAPSLVDNGLIEYYGPKNPRTIVVAMGSVIGTIKDAADEINATPSARNIFSKNNVGVLKIKTYRPFPANEVINIIKNTKYVAVIDKAITLGHEGPLAIDMKAATHGQVKAKIQSFIVGLGGRDITKAIIKKAISEVQKKDGRVQFIGKA